MINVGTVFVPVDCSEIREKKMLISLSTHLLQLSVSLKEHQKAEIIPFQFLQYRGILCVVIICPSSQEKGQHHSLILKVTLQ